MKIASLTVLAALALIAAPALGQSPAEAPASAVRAPDGAGAGTLTVQDHVEIEQLYAKYNHAIDSGNAEDWAATFTADGVFNNRFNGRDALIGFVNNWKTNGGLSRRHWNSNLLISATPQGARGSVYLMLMDVSVKPAVVLSTGMYSDELVKTANGWRFKNRAVKPDVAAAKPAAPATPDKPASPR